MATNKKDASRLTINQMNSFLRGELSALETYRQCIDKLGGKPARKQLESCRESHRQRADKLAAWISSHGGKPDTNSGVWGAFARLVQGASSAFGEKSAVVALEEGEDHGRDDYRNHLADLDPDARSFIEQEILPEQVRTHDQVSALKNAM